MPEIHVLRTKKNEMIEVAKVMAEKIKNSRGKTAVILPPKSLSVPDLVDKEFDNPEAIFTFSRP